MSRTALSADAFSYDNSIAFVLEGAHLEIVERGPAERSTWVRNGERLARLHYYWYYRAVDTVATSELAGAVIGQPGNHEANLGANCPFAACRSGVYLVSDEFSGANQIGCLHGLHWAFRVHHDVDIRVKGAGCFYLAHSEPGVD